MLRKILLLFDPKTTIRCGMVAFGSGFRFVVSAIKKDRTYVLFHGDTAAKPLFFMPPVAVNTTLEHAKVFFVNSPLNNENPDSWLDRNEGRVIPPGFTAEQIVNEWDVCDDSIYSATVTKESLGNYRNSLPKNRFIYSSIGVPLWDLAMLYSRFIQSPFVLWKITQQGSLLGYADKGGLRALCDFWPDDEDVKKEGAKIGEDLSLLIKSLSGSEPVSVIIPCFDGENKSIPEGFTIPNHTIGRQPDIEQVPACFHEPYACSLHRETHLDFADISDTQKSHTLEKKRRNFLTGLKITGIAGAVFALLLAIGSLTAFGLQRYAEKRIEPLKGHIKKIERGEKRLASLKNTYKKKAVFLGRESAVTFLLNEFQTVFPDGVWAEQIDISESDEKQWKVDIIALSLSTVLIPQLLGNLEKVRGVVNVRMIYSEQTKIEKTKNAIKVKIECAWGVE